MLEYVVMKVLALVHARVQDAKEMMLVLGVECGGVEQGAEGCSGGSALVGCVALEACACLSTARLVLLRWYRVKFC